MSSIENLPPIHYPNEENVDKTLFAPIFKRASNCRCMMGYFTSSALSELASSLAFFLRAEDASIQLIVSPNLSNEDLEAVKDALASDKNLLPLLFPGFEITEDALRSSAVKALSYLVASGKLEMKVALMDSASFHAKIWLFETDCGRVAVHGSGNFTRSGLGGNFEQLRLDKECPRNPDSDFVLNSLEKRFHQIWDDDYKGLTVHALSPQTISALKTLNQQYGAGEIDTDELALQLEQLNEFDTAGQVRQLEIPDWLNYSTGDFAHQGRAIQAWNEAGKKGILAIATGGGKTLTSLTAASLVQHEVDALFLVVAVPNKVLISQWASEVELFGIAPIVSLNKKPNDLSFEIRSAFRNLRNGLSKAEVLIVSHELLKKEKVINLLTAGGDYADLMLIGDEVHNLGSEGFVEVAPEIFQYRLGLSATVERQFDQNGTQFLYRYFGPVVYEFTVEEAIGNCLVGFDYFVHEVHLLEDELEEWRNLTYDIRRLSFASEYPDGDSNKERWKLLCLKRRRIIEGAVSKALLLREILPSDNSLVARCLIFCTDKNPEQLQVVNRFLSDRRLVYHQVTQEETSNKRKLAKIISAFSDDVIQVLTSKKVLDEGFNVPQTEVAYLLASSTVKRQWVQRLGRVLRKSTATGKEKAIIHDFVVIPDEAFDSSDKDLKSLILGEMSRVQYFSALSINGLEAGGAIDLLDNLTSYME